MRIDCFLTPDDLNKALRRDVVDGLSGEEKVLPAKWFYDERGSQLFDQITRLPEYYPTRRERAILATHADDIAAVSGAATLLELGAGSGEKTRLLLDAMLGNGALQSYIPVDVSGVFLAKAASQIGRDYPGLRVHAVVADYERHLHLLPNDHGRLIAFLGGTIGNMIRSERAAFLGNLRAVMCHDDWLLIGADLVKEQHRLVRAYNDVSGVTAAFNRNVLHVINRGLQADFVPEVYEHVALWDAQNEWIEMRLRATRDQAVRISSVDMSVTFNDGEEMRTEVSAKFRRAGLEAELTAADLEAVGWWTDPAGDFALCLARPADDGTAG